METTFLENSIDKRIKAIVAEVKGNRFVIRPSKLTVKEWTTKSLKKEELMYKMTFGFAIVLMLIMLIMGLVVSPGETISKSKSVLPMIAIASLLALAHQSKLKKEKLGTALYLLYLKDEIEKLKL